MIGISLLAGSAGGSSAAAEAAKQATADLTLEQCNQLARDWTKAVESGDLNQCDRLYDTDRFVDNLLGKLDFKYVPREGQLLIGSGRPVNRTWLTRHWSPCRLRGTLCESRQFILQILVGT
jgi:hypothetical protein